MNINCKSGEICVQGVCVSNDTCIEQGTCSKFSGFIQLLNNTFVGYDGEKFTNKKSIWNFTILKTLPNKIFQISNLNIDTLPIYCSYYTMPVETCQIGTPDSTEEFYLRKNANGTFTFYTIIVFLGKKQTTYVHFFPNSSDIIKLENQDSVDNQVLLVASDDQCRNVVCAPDEFCSLNALCQKIDIPENMFMMCMQDYQQNNQSFISTSILPLGLTSVTNPDPIQSNLYLSSKNSILDKFVFGNILTLNANGKTCNAIPINNPNLICKLNPIYIKINADNTVSFYTIDEMNQTNYISFYSKDFTIKNNQWSTIQKPIIDLTTKVKMYVNSNPPSPPSIICPPPSPPTPSPPTPPTPPPPTPPTPPSPPTPPTPSPPTPPTPSPPTPPTPSPPSPPTPPTPPTPPSPPTPPTPADFSGYLKNKYISLQKNSNYYIGWSAPGCVNSVCSGPNNLTNLNSVGDGYTSSAFLSFGFENFLPNGDLVIKNQQLVSFQQIDSNDKNPINLFYFSNFTAQSNWSYYLRYQLYLKKNIDDFSQVENAYSYSLYILDSNNTPNYILFDSYPNVNNVNVASTSLTNSDQCRFYLKTQ